MNDSDQPTESSNGTDNDPKHKREYKTNPVSMLNTTKRKVYDYIPRMEMLNAEIQFMSEEVTRTRRRIEALEKTLDKLEALFE